MNNGTPKTAREWTIVALLLLLTSAVVQAKAPPSEPDPEHGGIAVTARGRFPVGTHARGTQVYFVHLEDDVDMLAAEIVISSNFAKRSQIYLLNARPGRYVAVAAVVLWQGKDEHVVFFDGETIQQTEIEVIPGRITFMGDILVGLKKKMAQSDEAQAHYYHTIEPGAAQGGFFKRMTSGTSVRRGDFISVERGAEAEAEYWTEARDKVFKKQAAWRELAAEHLAALNSH